MRKRLKKKLYKRELLRPRITKELLDTLHKYMDEYDENEKSFTYIDMIIPLWKEFDKELSIINHNLNTAWNEFINNLKDNK